MTGRSRWPELERTLMLGAFFQLLALIGGVALAFAFPEFEAPAVRIAALAGIGALTGIVIVGILDVWFYLRPKEIQFESRRDEPAIVVGMVSQAAEVLLMVCLVLVGVGLSWQFGQDQMSLSRRGAGPYVPFSFVAMGIAGLILWSSVSSFPGWRPELVVTARGIASRGTGYPFTVGWGAITAVREVNNPGSFFSRTSYRENYIAIDTVHRHTFRIRPQHLKPSPYDVFLMLKQLHEEPALRSRIGRVSSADQLLAPVSASEAVAQPSMEDLPFSKPDGLRAAMVGLVVAAIVVPYAISRAGDTPYFTTEPELGTDSAEESPPGAFDDPLVEPDFGDGATCRDLLTSRPALARLLKGLETNDSKGKSRGTPPPSQILLNAAEAVASYAEAELEDGVATRWLSYSDALEQGAETVWFTEQSDAGQSFRWMFLVQQVPHLPRTTRQALAAIDAECS